MAEYVERESFLTDDEEWMRHKGENFIYCWAPQMKCLDDSEFFCKYGKREEKNTNASN